MNDKAVKQLALVNSGAFPYTFAWDLGRNPRLSIAPPTGTVTPGQRLPCQLTFVTSSPHRLDAYPITCTITNGPCYTMLLSGKGYKPKLELSMSACDFGKQFIQQQGMTPPARVLTVTNRDTHEVALDSSFEDTDTWAVECPPRVLQPGDTADVIITLRPQGEGKVTTMLPLDVNGLYTLPVELSGKGVPMLVGLEKPKQEILALGSLLEGGYSLRSL